MASPNIVHLPNGQSLTVKPVFGGLFFKPTDQNVHSTAVFPTGWTVVLQSEDYLDVEPEKTEEGSTEESSGSKTTHRIDKYTKPTLQNDNLFISSISFPNTSDFKAPASPTRQIAMMLWATLYWYFHQPEPSLFLTTEASKNTPDAGKPKGDWRINIKREGVFRGRNLLPKLERMGLIYSEESACGINFDGVEGWSNMFASRRAFWQLSARLFLFTLSPNTRPLSIPGSPYGSRPTSPVRGISEAAVEHDTQGLGRLVMAPHVPGPFASGSHLPTYYPPPPLQYIYANGVRHPIRPKPPQQGETFYARYIPSVGQHLSFRVASLSDTPVVYTGPAAAGDGSTGLSASLASVGMTPASSPAPTPTRESEPNTRDMTDLQLLHKWMNDPRVAKFWGCAGPVEVQEKFLRGNLESKHSFPAIGCWDGKPFGYMEVYWVKEDTLGSLLSAGEAKDWDRGFHVLVGEQEFRGAHRLSRWISALAHYCLLADMRTDSVVLEPRIDNERYACFLVLLTNFADKIDRFIGHLQNAGFAREKQIVFPHKTSWYMRLRRETFDGPAL